METRKWLYYILASMFLVVMVGSIGYYIIFDAEANFLDCMYMTVVSLTTVGYGEILQVTGNTSAEIFTMILITFGMGILLYGVSTLTAFIIEVDFSGILRKNKMIRPAAVDFLDSMLRSKDRNLRINQLIITENSAVCGKDIRGCGLKEKYGLLVLGSRGIDGQIEFNPAPAQVLNPGMTLIVMGDVEDVSRAKEAF